MNVSQGVMNDLLTLYMAGEASDDTRRLVEEYLKAHPEAAERMKSAESVTIPRAAPPDDLEHRAIARTRDLVASKSFWLGFALLFSYLPLSFGISGNRIVFLLFRDQPTIAGILLCIGMQAWIPFLIACRRLKFAGLQPVATTKARILWMVGGMAAWVPLVVKVGYWTHHNLWYWLPALGGIVVFIGEKLGQISELERAGAPISLFHSGEQR